MPTFWDWLGKYVYEMLNKLQHINSAQLLFKKKKKNEVKITFFIIMS